MLRKKRKLNHIKGSIKIAKVRKKEGKNRNKQQGQQIEMAMNMVDINPTTSIITLNIHGYTN